MEHVSADYSYKFRQQTSASHNRLRWEKKKPQLFVVIQLQRWSANSAGSMHLVYSKFVLPLFLLLSNSSFSTTGFPIRGIHFRQWHPGTILLQVEKRADN